MDNTLDRRTVEEIQKNVVKQSRRNAVSRLVRAKSDKGAIVGWKSDLNRILLVFNVCSISFAWLSLIVTSQTELVVNTHVTVSDIRHDVSKIREEINGPVRSVSASRVQLIFTGRYLRSHRPESGQQLRLPTNSVPDIRI